MLSVLFPACMNAAKKYCIKGKYGIRVGVTAELVILAQSF